MYREEERAENTAETHYVTVLFNGVLIPPQTKEGAIRQLSEAYQLPESTFEEWFTQKPYSLRKRATIEEADQLTEYFNNIGLEVERIPYIEESTDANSDFEAGSPEYEESLANSLKLVQHAINNNRDSLLLVRPASLWRRFFAWVIDFIFITIIFSLVLSVVLVPMGLVDPQFIAFYEYLMQELVNNGDAILNSGGKLIIPEEFQPLDFAAQAIRVQLYFLTLGVLYFGLFEGISGSSPGKKLLNMRVYSLRTKTLGLGVAFSRIIFLLVAYNISKIINLHLIGGLGSLLLYATLLMALFDRTGRKQTLYDRLTHTLVGLRRVKEIDFINQKPKGSDRF